MINYKEAERAAENIMDCVEEPSDTWRIRGMDFLKAVIVSQNINTSDFDFLTKIKTEIEMMRSDNPDPFQKLSESDDSMVSDYGKSTLKLCCKPEERAAIVVTALNAIRHAYQNRVRQIANESMAEMDSERG